MKNNGLLKYIVAVLLFTFSFTLVVSAEEEVHVSLEVGNTKYFADATHYYGSVTCEGIKMSGSGKKSINTSKGGTITFYPEGSLSYTPPVTANLGDKDSFSCVFELRDQKEQVKYVYETNVIQFEADVIEELRELTLDRPSVFIEFPGNTRPVSAIGEPLNGCPAAGDATTSKYFYNKELIFLLKALQVITKLLMVEMVDLIQSMMLFKELLRLL